MGLAWESITAVVPVCRSTITHYSIIQTHYYVQLHLYTSGGWGVGTIDSWLLSFLDIRYVMMMIFLVSGTQWDTWKQSVMITKTVTQFLAGDD